MLLGRTKFGRYVYAIGGNAEAARRAGVNLSRIRVLAFALCGLTAGITGIIYASYLGSISSNIKGGQNVLYAVAAAVIGGTSLFGGRGRMMDALLGGLVVGVIYNGLHAARPRRAGAVIWTGAVLLAAVTVDALARRGGTVDLSAGRLAADAVPGSLRRRPAGADRSAGRDRATVGPLRAEYGSWHTGYRDKRAPGSVKLRTGGDSPRPGRGHRPADPVEFRDRR